MKRILGTLTILILLVSCASTRGVNVTDSLIVPLLDNSCLNAQLDEYQLMEGNMNDEEFFVETYSSFDGKCLEIYMLAPATGQTIGKIRYDGKNISLDSSFFENDIIAPYVVFDFQLCHADLQTIAKHLEKYGLDCRELSEGNSVKRLILQDNNVIYEIEFKDSKTLVENRLRHYSYVIESI